MVKSFLPVSRDDLRKRGWSELDVIIITGDAYVDHPSFGAAVIGRVLEARGFRVGIIAQPDWRSLMLSARWAVRACSSASPRATLIPWWQTIPPINGRASATITLPAAHPACGLIAPSLSMPTACGRHSETRRLCSEASRQACAGLPTMITGTMRCAAQFC